MGTGRPLEPAPLLGIAYRAPYLHDGRAATLDDAISGHTTVAFKSDEREALRLHVRSR